MECGSGKLRQPPNNKFRFFSLMNEFQCSACFELLFEPISLPCSQVCCKRCFRIPFKLSNCNTSKMNTQPSSNSSCTTKESDIATQLIGAYKCPSKSCLKTHRYRNETVICLLSLILNKLFPAEQKALKMCKLGEELLRQKTPDFVIENYFTPAIIEAPMLQLPLILRSKAYSEVKQFDLARNDSKCANELNRLNKRGIVSEKMISWCEQQLNTKKCIMSEMREQLKKACLFQLLPNYCGDDVKSMTILKEKIRLELLEIQDFTCQLCLEVFNEPLCTPCGHVFCKICLIRSLDHSRCCPLCRTLLPTIGFFLNKPVLHVFEYFVSQHFNLRPEKIEINVMKPEWLPIMQCPLLFPTSQTSIHISDPHYRVMIKRVLETSRKFGCMLPDNNETKIEYGTIVEITQFEPLLSCDIITTCDGNLPRYVLQIQGLSRFKLQGVRCTNAGYFEGLCERFEDIEDSELVAWNPQKLEQLVLCCHQKITRLLNSIPDTARLHFERKYGKMPTECCEFSWWLGEVLPVNQYVLYKILGERRVESRLEIVSGWLDSAMACANKNKCE